MELVELGEVIRVSNQTGGIGDELGTAAARSKHRVEVPKRLLCLLAKLRAGGFRGPWIHSRLTGDEQKSAARTAGE